jgi:hypothetical protein
MVRRRCRYIVAIDAGCDPEYKFEDLGNAVRKISIDMNVRIEMKELNKLRPRGPDGAPPTDEDLAYHAYGIIHYPEADHAGEPGILLYIKPGYHGTEAADIQSYAMTNIDFPHQSTSDQWFSESQFESYRALGYEIMRELIRETKADLDSNLQPTLEHLLEKLAAH